MEIIDFLLSFLGTFVVKVVNRVFGTKIKLGYGGEVVTGFVTLVLLCFIAFWSIRGLVALGHMS